VDDEMVTAVAELRRASSTGGDLARPLLGALPVTGLSIATMGDLLPTGTVAATDDQAARLDELQFDLGEGPCWDAVAARRPVLEPDVAGSPVRVWPAFSRALADEPIGALFAFPLLLGPLALGAMDLWCDHAHDLSDEHALRASALAREVSRHLLRDAVREIADEQHDDAVTDRFSRRHVHQATGMVLAQVGVSPEDAELLLQGHAFATGTSMREVADDVLAGRLSFATRPTGIEESS
jgi:hypothetical protein